MGFRFRKSFKIAPGIKLNMNKKSTGITFGSKGVHYTMNSKGKNTFSAGVPGTGLYYTSTSGGSKKPNASKLRGSNMKWYKKPIWIIVLAFLFPFIGLYLLWKHTNWNKIVKIVLTVLACLIWVVALFSPDDTEPEITNTQTTTTVLTTIEQTTEEPTTKETTTEKLTKTTTEKQTTKKQAITTEKYTGRTVYVTPYGKKYHFDPDCAGENRISKRADEVDTYGACDICVN